MSAPWRVALMLVTITGCAGGPASARRPPCAEYAEPTTLGTIADPGLHEISGLAASRAHPGILYAHNDSGEPYARFFALRASGEVLAEYALESEPARDLEEIALGPGSARGSVAIYLADIGDNDARAGRTPRASISVLRVAEPAPSAGSSSEGEPPRIVIGAIERFVLRYPDTPYDCEAFFVDPDTGDLYLLAKVGEGGAPLLRARAPLSTSTPTILERLGSVLPAGDLGDAITASSLDATGRRLAVRTYRHVYLFERVAQEPWLATLDRGGRTLPRLHEQQGEAITFFGTDGTLVSVSEGDAAPLQALRPQCP